MNRKQFQILYREFLFRIVDLEVLSARAISSNCSASSAAS
jgi:hypothetical protein